MRQMINGVSGRIFGIYCHETMWDSPMGIPKQHMSRNPIQINFSFMQTVEHRGIAAPN